MNDGVFIETNSVEEDESDEALRRVYGEHAVFSRLRPFILVHLDSPDAAEIARREDGFDPGEFFFDNCPLCEEAKQAGGHIIFPGEGDEDDEDDEDGPADALDEERSVRRPSIEFAEALRSLGETAQRFDNSVRDRIPEWLADRVGFDILVLHDAIQATLWAQETEAEVESIERQLRRARATVVAVLGELPDAADAAAPLCDAIEKVSAAWNAL